MFTKAEITAYIVSRLVDGIADSITPSVLRDVLDRCLDRRYEAGEVGVQGIGEWHTLEQLLTDAVADISLLKEGAHTPQQIRDALTGLSGNERLGKGAVHGADFSLNYRGRLRWNSSVSQSAMGIQLSRGDMWVYDDGGLPDDGGSYANGDVLVILTTEPATPPWNLEDKNRFMIWRLSRLNMFSIGTIVREALEGLSDNEMLGAEKIRYTEDQSVLEALNGVEERLNAKEQKASHIRIICEDDDEGLTLTIPGVVFPSMLNINRTPYYGIQGEFFEGMDFRYRHVDGNTQIILNPGLSLVFVRNDIIDIRYTL
jgi:hypothetical protein